MNPTHGIESTSRGLVLLRVRGDLGNPIHGIERSVSGIETSFTNSR